MYNSLTNRLRGTGRTLAIGAATVLCALSTQAATAHGRSPQEFKSVVVRYADLNLGTTAGVQALYARLSSAADAACGGQQHMVELRQRHSYGVCYDETLAKAVRKVNSARLQALHAEHGPAQSVG
jgi:UrcA family protein